MGTGEVRPVKLRVRCSSYDEQARMVVLQGVQGCLSAADSLTCLLALQQLDDSVQQHFTPGRPD